MSSVHVDRNLLFGILALQLDFIGRDSLVAAMHAWVLQKSKPLGQILVEQGVLAPKARSALDALVEQHLELHQGDPQQSLAAAGLPGAMQSMVAQFADPDIKASLLRLATIAPAKPSEQTTLPKSEKATTDARFEILRSHAWGGLGEVYVAQDREVNREVALKRLHERYADNVDSRARFLREAEITGGLEHPGFVPVYGLGISEDGRPYYAMRFIRGQTLKEAIERFHSAGARTPSDRRIELRQLLGRFIAVCNAIEYAHSRGIIHRDLKPSNIMLGKYGETLVVDWGLSKALGHREPEAAADEHTLVPSSGSGSSETLPGSAIGTPAYMSPEQSEGRIEDMGPASDVYSLGATLYTILTGKEPFESTILGVVLGKVQTGDFAPPRQRNPSVPRALDAICLKAMSLLPKDRYPSCAELASDIEHWLADEPVTALKDPLSDRTVRWIKRHRVVAASSTALLATAFVGLAIGTGVLGRANSRIAAEATRATQAEASALKESERAKSNETAAIVAKEQTQDALTASLFEQARAVRLAGLPGRRLRALELLEEAEHLRSRRRLDSSSVPAGTDPSAGRQVVLTRSQLRSEALAALLLDDAHVVRQWGGVARSISSDGILAAASSLDVGAERIGLSITDLKTGKEVSKWEGEDALPFFGTSLALGPRGKRLAVLSIPLPMPGGKVSKGGLNVWQLPERKLLRELALPKQQTEPRPTKSVAPKGGPLQSPFSAAFPLILNLRFSPDGRSVCGILISVSGHRAVVWDLEGDGVGRAVGAARADAYPSAAFSPDSRLLAVASSGGKVALWNVARKEFDQEIEPPLETISAVGFAPDGALGIAGTESREQPGSQRRGGQKLLIWDVARNREIKRIASLSSDLNTISFSPDGTRVALSNGLAGNIWVLDLANSKPAVPLNDQALQLGWTDDSRHLLSMAPESLKMWAFSEESPVSDLAPSVEPDTGIEGPLAFSPDGRLLAVARGGTPHVDLYDRTTGKAVRRFDSSEKLQLLQLSFSPDGKQLVCLGHQNVIVWDVETGRQKSRLDVIPSQGKLLTSAGIRADGTVLVGELDESNPVVLEAATGKVVWRGRPKSGFGALVSSDGRLVTAFLSMSAEPQPIAVVELSTGRDRFQLQVPSKVATQRVQTLCEFSPDCRWLLALHLEVTGTINFRSGTPVSRGGRARFSGLEVSAHPWTADIWDVRSGTRHLQIEGSSRPVARIFSRDGRYLAVGMANGAVRLWDMRGREELFDWHPFGDQPEASSVPQNFAFTADGASLVVPTFASHALRMLNLVRANEQLGTAGLNW